MAAVDPQLNQIPRKLLDDPELRDYFENLERYRHDMWIRTGGPVDAIEDGAVQEQYAWLATPLAEETQEFVYPTLQPIVNVFRAVTVTASYTAAPYDFINAKNGSTITFPKYPDENSVIIVRNGDGSTIGLNGNGKNINGETTGTIRRKSTSIVFHYFIDSDEWLVR